MRHPSFAGACVVSEILLGVIPYFAASGTELEYLCPWCANPTHRAEQIEGAAIGLGVSVRHRGR